MRAVAIAASLLACCGTSAAAQAPGELAWALTNCLSNVGDFKGAIAGLRARGYAYTKEDFGGGPSDVIHWFTSKDQGTTVAVVFGNAHDGNSCRVIPRGVTVGQAAPYARSAAEQVLGVPFGRGRDACSARATVNGLDVEVAAGSAGQDPMCEGGAPAQIMLNVTRG